MDWLARFLVYNLLASMLAGLLAWCLALGAVLLLRIRSSARSFSFLALPFFKSLLVLAGVGLVFPWPAQPFVAWHGLAATPLQVLPILLAWIVITGLVSVYLTRQARRAILAETVPAAEVDPRAQAIFAQVEERFRQVPCPECSDDLCCLVEQALRPRLLISAQLRSPLALILPDNPAIILPAGLAELLDDDELAGALAHEMAHFVLRRPAWCSASMLQNLAWISPIASLLGKYLHQQEEKACDELAVKMMVPVEVYARMLTKNYRFARDHAHAVQPGSWQASPGLLGFKPLLSQRVENLLRTAPAGACKNPSSVVIWSVWLLLFFVLFLRWS